MDDKCERIEQFLDAENKVKDYAVIMSAVVGKGKEDLFIYLFNTLDKGNYTNMP